MRLRPKAPRALRFCLAVAGLAALIMPLAGNVKSAALAHDGRRHVHTVTVAKGDTLMALLIAAGSHRRDAGAAIAALRRHVNPRRLQVGQELAVVFDRAAGSRRRLAAVGLAVGKAATVVAGRNGDGRFTSWLAREPLSTLLDGLGSVPAPKIAFTAEPGGAVHKSLRLHNGDTLMNALLRIGSERADAQGAVEALKAVYDPRKLKAGQTLTVAFVANGDGGPMALHGLKLGIDPGRRVEVGRVVAGGFAAREVDVPLERVHVRAAGRIESSLYEAATSAGIPNPVMMELIRAFSFDVDFQREIQRGDGFDVLFERYLGETGEVVREGNVVYAVLTLSGQPLKVYRHTNGRGLTDYYDERGHSVRKALLRTPVDGARLTSRYGKRKHPILGYTKMHRGVDFAARKGTTVHAAGDGVIDRMGRNGDYGRYIRIRHKGRYSTAYAHLGRYAKGLRKGRRVKQGQVIGYVGSTGRSTGPHLHYEVLRNGRRINPLKVKLPSGARLKGVDLAAFQAARAATESLFASLPPLRNLAEEASLSHDEGGSPGDVGRVDAPAATALD